MTTDLTEREDVACPLCSSNERETIYHSFSPYAVVRCRSCGFHFLSPRLTEPAMLTKYREDTYFVGDKDGYTLYAEQEAALRATFRHLLEELRKRHITGGSMVEIGCGYGYLLEEAKDYFSVRTGTDFSPRAVAEASTRADRVYEGGLDQIPPGERFDFILAIQVIEHVYRPIDFLRGLRMRLRPGGSVVIATPNMGSFWRRIMGRRWPSFKIPEHILFFDKDSLASCLRAAGFLSLREIPYPHAFPLSLIAAKLGMSLPAGIGRHSLWLPATTIALCGVAPDE